MVENKKTKKLSKDSLEKKEVEAPVIGEISPEEAQQLAMMRQAKAKREECAAKIDEVLEEYNAVLQIDPRSPHGAPQIKVVLR